MTAFPVRARPSRAMGEGTSMRDMPAYGGGMEVKAEHVNAFIDQHLGATDTAAATSV